MKISRERVVLCSVLGVAGLGLLMDRVILGSDITGPAESSAGVVDAFDPALQADLTQTELPAVEATAVVELSDKPSLADRLRQVADGESASSRDAFALPKGWATAQGDASGTVRPQDTQAFRNTYQLDAVLDTGVRKCAVVNGKTVYPGQSIDGYRLVSVRERTAVFEINGTRVELELFSPTPSS